MVLGSVAIFFGKGLSVTLFSKVGQNIVEKVRIELYEAVLRKEMGWHDDRKNSSGVITATLASDVQLLDGASSAGSAAKLEAAASFVWGIALAFYFSWPIALVGCGVAPFMAIGSYI